MKIHFLERDTRRFDSDFLTNCGSFSVIQHIIREGLREIGAYSENPDDAEFVGVADCLELSFKYKDKKPFIIAFLDNINTIADIQYHYYHQNKGVQLFSVNQQTSDIYKKYGIDCKVLGPGILDSYWHPTKPKNETFTFLSTGFANQRSGIDQLIEAYHLAFNKNKDIQLIIKDTSNSEKLKNVIYSYVLQGTNIKYIGERTTFDQMRDLYSSSHVFASVFRHSAHGLGIAEAGLCGCEVLAGDFDPSNKINQHGKLLKPEKEVEIYSLIPYLTNVWGLVDTFGKLTYKEPPRFFEYNIENYSKLLIETYKNWKPQDYKNKVLETWNYLESARKLGSYLKYG